MSFHWKDNEREELETSIVVDRRELMVHVFYPSDAGASGERAVYLPDADEQRGEWNETQLTRIRAMRSFSRENAPLPPGETRYQVAIFSPGGGTKALTYQALIEDLASHGWVVAAIDPPYNALAVRFTDGRVLRNLPAGDQGWPDTQTNASSYNQRIVHWSRDVIFVIDRLTALDNGSGPFGRRLDLQRGVGVFGHSRGGTAAGTVRLLDTRVRSAINLDGVGSNGAYVLVKGRNVGGAQPLLWVLSSFVERDIWRPYRAVRLISGGALRVYLTGRGITHRDFSDEPFWDGSMTPRTGPAKVKAISDIRAWVRAFFDGTVRGDWVGLKHLVRRTSTRKPNKVAVFGPFWRNSN